VVAVIFTIQATAAFTLLVIAGTDVGAVAGVVAFGLGFGISSLATPAPLADRYGTVAYATLAGILTVPITLASAGTPLCTAALHTATDSYAPVLTVVGTGCLIAATGILTGAKTPSPIPAPVAAAAADPQTATQATSSPAFPSGVTSRTGPPGRRQKARGGRLWTCPQERVRGRTCPPAIGGRRDG
jgi:hypothetical protein